MAKIQAFIVAVQQTAERDLLFLKTSSKVLRLTLNCVPCLFGTNHHGQRVEELVSQACVIFPPPAWALEGVEKDGSL